MLIGYNHACKTKKQLDSQVFREIKVNQDFVKTKIEESLRVKQFMLEDRGLHRAVAKVAEAIINAFDAGKKVLICGNGGSAADAQHMAAEFSGRFYLDRRPLEAEALHCNTSALTAIANDYSFDDIFSRQVLAKGKQGDVLIGISTSGNSPNVLEAANAANELGMLVVGLTGRRGGKLAGISKHCLKMPSDDTPRIQECHITICHIICEIVEKGLFGEANS